MSKSESSEEHKISFHDDEEGGITAFQKRLNAQNIMKIMLKKKKYDRVCMVQSFCRGHLVRKYLFEQKKHKHLKENFEFMDAMKHKLYTDIQIHIRYTWLRYKKRKAAKKAANKAAKEAE